MNVSYLDHVTNVEILKKTEMIDVTTTIQQRRLKWLGHELRMKEHRLPRKGLEWKSINGKRKRGRPKATWKSTVDRDLRAGELTWDEATQAAQYRDEWRAWTAQCVKNTGGTKVKGKVR